MKYSPSWIQSFRPAFHVWVKSTTPASSRPHRKRLLNGSQPFPVSVAIKNVASVEILKELGLPLPPLETQQQIVAEIEAEQSLVAANRELISRFEKKIQATLARVWGEEPDVEEFLILTGE
jgi:hypothetical protein